MTTKPTPKLIVMLTQEDRTVENAAAVFEQCKDTEARIFGCKASTLPREELQELHKYMHARGKQTAPEVVAYSEEECLHGALTALACGCNYLMGTKFFDSVNGAFVRYSYVDLRFRNNHSEVMFDHNLVPPELIC